MKLGYMVKPNKKGQIVIPAEIRNVLKITADVPLNLILRDNGVYMYPIKDVVYSSDIETSYVNLLKKTQGKWSKNDWNKTRKERKK